MFIEKIIVKNFRIIGSAGITLNCNKGMNIILGENNSGKSAVIDALRLALSAGAYRKNLFIKTSDFHVNKYGEQADIININIFFNELTEEQASSFFMLTNGTDLKKAELHIEYTLYMDKKRIAKVREDIKGGTAFNNVPREIYDNINLLYLAALRDAESDLKPSRNGQVANILYSVAKTSDDRDRIIKVFQKANEAVTSDNSIKSVESIINKNLLNMEKDELQEKVQISLVDPTFESVASLIRIDYVNSRLLRISVKDMLAVLKEVELTKEDIKDKKIACLLPDKKHLEIYLDNILEHKELKELYKKLLLLVQNQNITINQNGLGYNNILHMATSLGDLQEKPIEEEISILLVEEPEAHLHPQLLDLLFSFFKKANKNSNIQLFITSHSPTLVAKADINSVHILNSKQDSNSIVSIKETALNDTEKLDLKRYLDVTKSQMFFARRVVFVEGISEAILFNEFANLLGKPFDKYSVEIVNINGVAFEPFAKLFQKNEDKNYINIPCAIVSDNDRCTNNDDPYRITKAEKVYSNIDTKNLKNKLENGSISYRAQNLLAYNQDNICVKLAEKTLEYELAMIEQNIPLLLEVLDKEHPTISNDIQGKVKPVHGGTQNQKYETIDKIALRIWIAIQDCKGIFAQRLANEISKISSGERTDVKFEVPKYIHDAIDYIIK
ncbi:AAA ATPase domain protein [anaerobic digester metagenome]